MASGGAREEREASEQGKGEGIEQEAARAGERERGWNEGRCSLGLRVGASWALGHGGAGLRMGLERPAGLCSLSFTPLYL